LQSSLGGIASDPIQAQAMPMIREQMSASYDGGQRSQARRQSRT